MADPSLTLYHFPGACSRVSVCALEMAGLPYTLELVNLSAGAQSDPAYRRISPLAKVPSLLVDGVPLVENSAIITFVDLLRPDAGILPLDDDPRLRAETVGGLSFCGGTLHPIVRGLANPQRLTTGDEEGVRQRSRELAGKSFDYAEARIVEQGWWLGIHSIIDVYLDWAFSVARCGGLEGERFPALLRLEERLQDLPAYCRMQEAELRSRAALGL